MKHEGAVPRAGRLLARASPMFIRPGERDFRMRRFVCFRQRCVIEESCVFGSAASLKNRKRDVLAVWTWCGVL
jgi:hypothetical protein